MDNVYFYCAHMLVYMNDILCSYKYLVETFFRPSKIQQLNFWKSSEIHV